ncbi:hypothetical protein GOBAR_DD26779 [Gossypium barbadense]|nr:hypothetical protein GOBAR_DD26779 [Gossypium barbadense]
MRILRREIISCYFDNPGGIWALTYPLWRTPNIQNEFYENLDVNSLNYEDISQFLTKGKGQWELKFIGNTPPKSAAPPHPLPPNINSSFLRTKSPPSQIACELWQQQPNVDHITGNKIRNSFMFSRGKLPGPLRQLQMDLRKLMLPYTALKLKIVLFGFAAADEQLRLTTMVFKNIFPDIDINTPFQVRSQLFTKLNFGSNGQRYHYFPQSFRNN